MYRYKFPETTDPCYESEVAQFVRACVYDRIGYDVIPDSTLIERVVELDHRDQVIKVRPGLAFRKFHTAINRSVLYVVGGSAWAPEFRTQARLTVVPELPRQRGE